MERVSTAQARIREAMASAGLKQADLVLATGLNRSTVSRYLSGEVEPRQDAAHKLAVALGVSEMWLWGYDVPKQRTAAQKKNDDLVKVIVQLRSDSDFFDVVQLLADLPPAEYVSIKQILKSLRRQ